MAGTHPEIPREVSEMSHKNDIPPNKLGQDEEAPSLSRVSGGREISVRGDTPWERQLQGPARGFWKMLAASALLHLFLTPGPALLGLVAMLPAIELTSGEEFVEVELTAIPVGPVAPEPTLDKSIPAEPEPAAPMAPPEEDENAEDAPDEPARSPEPVSPAPAEPVAEGPRETEAFGDPVALAGSAGSIADSNANVKLFLFTEVIRTHPLGVKIGELLRRTPQWRDFFGPSNIDPVEDIDRVLIAGPQLRNSSEVVAVVQHKMGRDRIEAAFNGLVARQGKWIDQPGLVAKARADGADRVFAAPNDKVVLVAPLTLEKQVRAMGAETKFPPSAKDVALTAYIVTPANVAKGTGIQLPKSIKWARLDLRPLAGGGAVLKILALDETEEMAEQNALFFENLIRAVTTVDPKNLGIFGAGLSKLGMKKKEYIKSVKFTHEGDKIQGTIEVTESQMVVAVGFLEGYLPPLPLAPVSPNPSPTERDDAEGVTPGPISPEERPSSSPEIPESEGQGVPTLPSGQPNQGVAPQ